MNRFNLNDDELAKFIKRHAPKAPAPPADECESIIKKLNAQKRQRLFGWCAASGALAAGLAAFIVFHHVDDQAPTAVALETWIDDADLFAKELPTTKIGEIYFDLVAINNIEE